MPGRTRSAAAVACRVCRRWRRTWDVTRYGLWRTPPAVVAGSGQLRVVVLVELNMRAVLPVNVWSIAYCAVFGCLRSYLYLALYLVRPIPPSIQNQLVGLSTDRLHGRACCVGPVCPMSFRGYEYLPE